MKASMGLLALLTAVVLFSFSGNAQCETIWSNDVSATHSSSSPLATVAVTAGSVLTISAGQEDLWQVSNYGVPTIDWTNADGIFGFDYQGIPVGALAGRMGLSGDWFFIGTDFSQTIPDDGILYLACWEDPALTGDNNDQIHVSISRKTFDPADLDQDDDVDGQDLYGYLTDMSVLGLDSFAGSFGWAKVTNNADLESLSVSQGELVPEFLSDQTDYLVEVGTDTSEVVVTPVPSDPLAGVWINGIQTTPENPVAVSLEPGSNYIPIRVVSQDSTIEKTYSLLVTRKGSAALSGLFVAGYGLSPAFSPDNAVYTLSAAPGTTQILVAPQTADPLDEIHVNDTPVVSGTSVPILLNPGVTEAKICVTADDGSRKWYFIYAGMQDPASLTVYLVDHADEPGEFESLNLAIEYLNSALALEEIGEIRIQTTSPIAADRLDMTRKIRLAVDPGASNEIQGPSGVPLVINALAGGGIAGLSFTGSPSYTINSDTGLAVTGASFSSDIAVNLSGSVSSPLSKGSGTYTKDFNFVSNFVTGYLNIALAGSADSKFTAVGNNAAGLLFDATGSIVGDGGLCFKANPVKDLKINASLKGNTRAEILAHSGVKFSSLGFEFDENASLHLEQHTTAHLMATYKGLHGLVEYKNVTTTDARYTWEVQQGSYSGTGNSITNWDLDLGYSFGGHSVGVTEKGGYIYGKLNYQGENVPANAQVTIGLDEMTMGKVNIVAAGKASITFENGTTITLDVELKLPTTWGNLDFKNMHCLGMLTAQFPESGVELFLNAQYARMDQGAVFDFVNTGTLSGTGDRIISVTGGIQLRFGSLPESKDLSQPFLPEEAVLVFKNLELNDTQGKPGLYMEGIKVPVTIQDSKIHSQTWSIVGSGIDSPVTIKDNSDLKGGIFLDGDPHEAGCLIDQPYSVSNNTISQNMAGGSCLWSHAVRRVEVTGNTMTAGPGAHGIMLSGGKITIDGGSILSMAPVGSTALGVGPSFGGTVGYLDVSNMDLISGFVIPSENGYVRLAGNTFSDAIVFDVEQGRQINDPMAEGNSGLNPDEDIQGCLIDWNEDEHNCPDYPPKCDKWDEDKKECGCGDDGIDPPSPPGI